MKNALSIGLIIGLALSVIPSLSSATALAPSVSVVDKYALSGGTPVRIATDTDGKLYITNTQKGRVYIYSSNGVLLKVIDSIQKPLGIAVTPSRSGVLLVSDLRSHSVFIFKKDGRFLKKLGSGDSEFSLPNDIAVSDRLVYVTDSMRKIVKVFYVSGKNSRFRFSFGGDVFHYPTGIAVDSEAGEVFVIDYENGNKTIYVRVFDLEGNHISDRDFPLSLAASTSGRTRGMGMGMGGGGGAGKLLRPLGITVDDTRVYVTDAFNSVVAVYDKSSGAFLSKIGNYGTASGEFKTPTGVAFGLGKLYVANTNNQRVEVLGIEPFSGLKLVPNTINFSGYRYGETITQTVNITSTGNDTSWRAYERESWLGISSTSGTTPSSLDVTVDPSRLRPGNYSSQVVFRDAVGEESVLIVNLDVKDISASLSVVPSALNFIYQKNSASDPRGSIVVSSVGRTVRWKASEDSDWIRLGRRSGRTPATIDVRLQRRIMDSMAIGSHFSQIRIDAEGVEGSPGFVYVYLDIVEAGTIRVTTNIDEAGFTLTGPETLTGTGRSWSAENVKTGTYSVVFSDVPGYLTPADTSFSLESGETVDIEGHYYPTFVTNIIAGSADPEGNRADIVSLDGVPELSITPFATPSAVYVASGDIDGDGVEDIVVTDGKREIKVFAADGTLIAEHNLPSRAYQTSIATADTNGDWKDEIFVSYRRGTSQLKMKRLELIVRSSYSRFKRRSVRFDRDDQNYRSYNPRTISAGDIDGDRASELIVADQSTISAYDFGRRSMTLLWSRTISESVPPNVATGDLNGDGMDEVCYALGPDPSNDAIVKCLNGDGTDYGLELNAFADYNYKYGATVTLGDIDYDGMAEIAVGAGPGSGNQALIRLFTSDGLYIIDTFSAMDSFYGVNISFGRFAE
jgi:sugar lactone lactonase YvrE